jgi:hypothetical protein
MKYSIIKYQFQNGTTEHWHREVARFVSAPDGDRELKGRIRTATIKTTIMLRLRPTIRPSRRCSRAIKAYQAKTQQLADGEVTVTPVELTAETAA